MLAQASQAQTQQTLAAAMGAAGVTLTQALGAATTQAVQAQAEATETLANATVGALTSLLESQATSYAQAMAGLATSAPSAWATLEADKTAASAARATVSGASYLASRAASNAADRGMSGAVSQADQDWQDAAAAADAGWLLGHSGGVYINVTADAARQNLSAAQGVRNVAPPPLFDPPALATPEWESLHPDPSDDDLEFYAGLVAQMFTAASTSGISPAAYNGSYSPFPYGPPIVFPPQTEGFIEMYGWVAGPPTIEAPPRLAGHVLPGHDHLLREYGPVYPAWDGHSQTLTPPSPPEPREQPAPPSAPATVATEWPTYNGPLPTGVERLPSNTAGGLEDLLQTMNGPMRAGLSTRVAGPERAELARDIYGLYVTAVECIPYAGTALSLYQAETGRDLSSMDPNARLSGFQRGLQYFSVLVDVGVVGKLVRGVGRLAANTPVGKMVLGYADDALSFAVKKSDEALTHVARKVENLVDFAAKPLRGTLDNIASAISGSGRNSGLIHGASDDVTRYWNEYYRLTGHAGDGLATTIAQLEKLGFDVRAGSHAAYVRGTNIIKYGPNTRTWELYEEALHFSVEKGLGRSEILTLTKELRKTFRYTKGNSAAAAAEEIFVKRQLLRRLDIDGPTRVLLSQQIEKLRIRGLRDGY